MLTKDYLARFKKLSYARIVFIMTVSLNFTVRIDIV